MKIRLIALDLDGTFLKSPNIVSDANAAAVEKAAAAGVTVAVSTGRVFGEIPDSVKSIPAIGYYITSNGAAVLDRNGHPVYSKLIPKELSDKAMEIIFGCDCLPDLYIGGKAYIRKFSDSELPRYALTPKDFDAFRSFRVFVNDLEEFYRSCGQLAEKINVFFGDTQTRDQVIERLKQLSPAPQLTYSMATNLEMTAPDCSKGAALSKLCKKLGIFAQEVMAVGDSNNDLSMLDFSGISVAMGNSDNFVKNYASYETDTCENDGAAKAIERFLSGQF